MLRRLRRTVEDARTLLWATSPGIHEAFVMGYVSALNDIERTGLRPLSDRTKREAAKRSFNSLTGGGDA